MSELFNFILELGFWQWCGVLMLCSVVFPCIAASMYIIGNFRVFTIRTIKKNKEGKK